MSFTSDLKLFAKQTDQKIETVVRVAALKVFTKVVLRTPVDEGQLRGNWQPSLNRPKSGKKSNKDSSGSKTIRGIKSVIGNHKAGQAVYLVNNMPYARVVEEGLYNHATKRTTASGFSSQAPKGMVRVTVAEFQSIVAKEVRKVNK